jgi:hypothetical protein
MTLVVIIFILIGIALFLSHNNRVEIEKAKAKTVKTVIIEKKGDKEKIISETTEVITPTADPDGDTEKETDIKPKSNVLNKIWDAIK